MSRLALLAFGVFAYACFLASFAAGADFITGAGFVRGIDAPAALSVPAAIAIDVALLALFGISHSVMARPGFKRRWTKVVPPRRRAQRLRADLQHLPGPGVLAVARPARVDRTDLERDLGRRARRPVGAGRGRLRAGHRLDVHDQPLRPVRPAPGVAGRARPSVRTGALQATRHLPSGAPPADAGPADRLLGDADDDVGPRAVRGRHDRRTSPSASASKNATSNAPFGESYRRYRREVRAVIPLPRFISAAKPPTPAPTRDRSPGPG